MYKYISEEKWMIYIIEKEWERLQKKLPDIQIFYVLIALLARKRECIRQGKWEWSELTNENFCEVFRQVPQYDLKEAAVRFVGKIEWSLIEYDKQIQEALRVIDRQITEDIQLHQENKSLNAILEMAGNKGIYIATPQSVSVLIMELFVGVKVHRMADFCSGMAKLGMDLWQSKMKKEGDFSFCGIELDPTLCNIAELFLFLNGINKTQIIQRDILLPDDSQKEKFDFIVMDIPRGRNKSESLDLHDPRLVYYKRKKIYTDWIYIQDALYHLADNGYAVILATSGATVRANEKELREQIIIRDWLEAVITLPANLYPNTRTGTELLIFHKGKSFERKGKTLFIDINGYYYRARRNAYAISEEGIDLATEIFQNFKEMKEISVIKNTIDISRQDFSFKPVQYMVKERELKQENDVTLQDIAEVYRGFQALNREVADENGTVIFLNVKDIQNGFIDYESAEKMSAENPACKSKYRIREDDILITTKGTSIKISIVDKDPPEAYISGNITLVRVMEGFYYPEILYEYFSSQDGREELERIQSGTTIKLINNSNLREMRVPLYAWELQVQVGEELKCKRIAYQRQSYELMKQYQRSRKQLLELLH